MGDFLFSLFYFLVGILILVAVHEFGHFWVARRCGVQVLRFSIGFGNALWKKMDRRNETEYVIASIPLGGYVKMLDEREMEVPEDQAHRAFNRQPLAARSAIVAAGPLINLAFAVLVYWVVFMLGDTILRPVIGAVTPNSVADDAGFRAGDELIALEDRKITSWEDVVIGLLEAAEGPGNVSIRVKTAEGQEDFRQLQARGLTAQLESQDPFGELGVRIGPLLPAEIGEVVAGEPADQAGIQPGDRILAMAGTSVADWTALVKLIKASPGKEVGLQLERAGSILDLRITPALHQEGDQIIGRIGAGVRIPEGFASKYRAEVRYGPLESMGLAVDKTWQMSSLMVEMLWRMITGTASVEKNLGSVISIGKAAGQSAELGLTPALKLLAQISIVLGIMNLLPIPMLDGGHLTLYAIEGIRGKPLSIATQEAANRVGLSLLLALIGVALYLDIIRLLG
jgi:regulator of sigma E protease